jgi:hypothetical protein
VDSDDADAENQNESGNTLLFVFERGYTSFFNNVLLVDMALPNAKTVLFASHIGSYLHVRYNSELLNFLNFWFFAVIALETALLPAICAGLGPLVSILISLQGATALLNSSQSRICRRVQLSPS